MAVVAEGDQVDLRIVSELAPGADVVNLETVPSAAELTAPSVALENLPTQSSIGFRVEPQPGAFWAKRGHEAFHEKRQPCQGLKG